MVELILALKVIKAIFDVNIRKELEFELNSYYKIKRIKKYHDEYVSMLSILDIAGFTVYQFDGIHTLSHAFDK